MALNHSDRPAAGDGERDQALDRIYRAAGREEPPPHLDAALRAAARRGAGAGPRALSALRAWHVPVSLAAVLVLSVSVVILMREEGGEALLHREAPATRDPSAPRAPAARPQPAAPKASSTVPATPDAVDSTAGRGASVESGTGALSRDRSPSRPKLAQRAPEPFQRAPEAAGRPPAERAGGADLGAGGSAAPAATPGIGATGGYSDPPEAAPAAKAASPLEDAVGAARGMGAEAPMARSGAAPAAGPGSVREAAREDRSRVAESQDSRRTEAPAAPPASESAQSRPAISPEVATMAKALHGQPREKWLERIRELRDQGRRAEAEELLVEFKRRFPDHP